MEVLQMDAKTKTMIFRGSLVGAGMIAMFWTIYGSFTGGVPVIKTAEWAYMFPFDLNISRWWDMLIGPIWYTTAIILIRRVLSSQTEIAKILNGLFLGLCIGLFIGLIFGSLASINHDVVSVLIISLGLSLLLGLMTKQDYRLGYDLGISLGSSLGFSLICGLAFGIGWAITYYIGHSFASLKSSPAILKFINWLFVVDN